MNTLTIIYLVTAFAVGTFVGMVLELIADDSLIHSLEDENRHLRIKLEAEEKKPERIEIIDRTSVEAQNLFDPF